MTEHMAEHMAGRNPITGKVDFYTNPLVKRNRTYGEMVTDLRTRLGYVTQGPSANNNRPLLDSFLQEAHEYVFSQLKPSNRRKKAAITLEPGSWLYDWHNDEDDEDIEPGWVVSVWLVDGDGSRFPMRQGITEKMREDAEPGQPARYDDMDGQIELYPVPDRPYRLLLEYVAGPTRFARDTDRPSVPARLVFLYALYLGQVHYRMPAYQATSAAFNALLSREKAKEHEGRRYVVNDADSPHGFVVGGKGRYRFVVR